MLIDNQIVKTSWNPTTTNYYKEKGYTYTGKGTDLFVNLSDLPHSSHAKVRVICDFCGKEYIKQYKDYFVQHNGGDCCFDCEGKKSLASTESKYGKGYRGKKLREITFERYGVEQPMYSEEIKNRLINTNMERYGVPFMFCLDRCRSNVKEVGWTDEVRQKRSSTNIERYGASSPLSNIEVRKKIAESYYKNGSMPTSSQQLKLFEQLNSIYSNCELNYPCGRYFLDCMIVVNGTKIDVEYDGRYWHQNTEKDSKRNDAVILSGYKVLRIISNYNLPDNETIIQAINQLINSKEKITVIDLED